MLQRESAILKFRGAIGKINIPRVDRREVFRDLKTSEGRNEYVKDP